ncbi:MAG: hypothetical protein WDA18_03690 [Candidatus Ratteibacteria bacterium]
MKNNIISKKKAQNPEGSRISAGIALLLLPFLYPIIAFFMKRNLGYQPSSTFFEEILLIRYLQYALYFSGLALFFFSDLLIKYASRIAKRITSNNPGSYSLMTAILMMVALDYIALSGFIGFLISGNFSWVVIFAFLEFFGKIRYFPKKNSSTKPLPTL